MCELLSVCVSLRYTGDLSKVYQPLAQCQLEWPPAPPVTFNVQMDQFLTRVSLSLSPIQPPTFLPCWEINERITLVFVSSMSCRVWVLLGNQCRLHKQDSAPVCNHNFTLKVALGWIKPDCLVIFRRFCAEFNQSPPGSGFMGISERYGMDIDFLIWLLPIKQISISTQIVRQFLEPSLRLFEVINSQWHF